MQGYEYKGDGGRILCILHHRLRCGECHYVSELRDENRRYRELVEDILCEMEDEMFYYSDHCGGGYNSTRYDEVKGWYDFIKDKYETMQGGE